VGGTGVCVDVAVGGTEVFVGVWVGVAVGVAVGGSDMEVDVAVGRGVKVAVDVDVAAAVGRGVELTVAVGVLVDIAVDVAEGRGVPGGGGTTPNEIVTTKPLAVAESTETVMMLPPSVKLSPTVHIAPASPVLPFPSASTTWAGFRRVVSTSWMITASPGNLTS
jgi:hypothetical protein